mgnify:CR=1 FL=1
MAPIYGARLVNVIFGTITAGLNLRIGKTAVRETNGMVLHDSDLLSARHDFL